MADNKDQSPPKQDNPPSQEQNPPVQEEQKSAAQQVKDIANKVKEEAVAQETSPSQDPPPEASSQDSSPKDSPEIPTQEKASEAPAPQSPPPNPQQEKKEEPNHSKPSEHSTENKETSPSQTKEDKKDAPQEESKQPQPSPEQSKQAPEEKTETDKPQESQTPQEKTESEPTNTPENPPATNNPSEASNKESSSEESPQKPKKRFLFFGRKKTTPSKEESKPITPETAAQAIDQQIIQAKSKEYFVIRIRKNLLLAFLGLFIIFLWTMPLLQSLYQKYQNGDIQFSFTPNLKFWQKQTSEESSNNTPEQPEGIKIRILDSTNGSGEAQQIADLLKDSQYPYVEIINNTDNTYTGVSVVTKPDNQELNQKLQELLYSRYQAGSNSAELTVDSDFDAVIMYGFSQAEQDNSPASATPTPSPQS